ncbi:MAG: hypothetical protein MMC23_001075 [Stictis urceolatum]|nr:hypothetical protein [Stictis urceolata]
MAPIRLALTGLSSTAKTSWAAGAHLPYLLSPLGQTHYTLVALLNSSVSAAEAAKAHFNLPAHVRTYGNPASLAADPDVDLVVCCTRVDTHFSNIQPSLRVGKKVYVEWPLAENLARGDELLACVTDGGVGSVVGLQGRVSPVFLKVGEVLQMGRLGRVLSSDVRAFGHLLPKDRLPGGLEYFADRKVGGNQVTIEFAHMIDAVLGVLGEWDRGFKGRMQVQRPELGTVCKDGDVGTKVSDVPDFLAVHGALRGKGYVRDGATLAATFRAGPPFKGEPALVWSINGEKGELMVSSESGAYLHSYEDAVRPRIRIHDHATDQVEDIEWDWAEWQKELPIRSRIVAEVYERYAKWWENGRPKDMMEETKFPTLCDAVARLRDFEELFAQYDRQ